MVYENTTQIVKTNRHLTWTIVPIITVILKIFTIAVSLGTMISYFATVSDGLKNFSENFVRVSMAFFIVGLMVAILSCLAYHPFIYNCWMKQYSKITSKKQLATVVCNYFILAIYYLACAVWIGLAIAVFVLGYTESKENKTYRDDREKKAGMELFFNIIYINSVTAISTELIEIIWLINTLIEYLHLRRRQSRIRKSYYWLIGGNPETCFICNQEYVDGSTLGVLGCKHYFHWECISGWFGGDTICPRCVEPILTS